MSASLWAERGHLKTEEDSIFSEHYLLLNMTCLREPGRGCLATQLHPERPCNLQGHGYGRESNHPW